MTRLVSDTIDRADINALCEWLQQEPIPRLTKGDLTVEFERRWAEYIGTEYAVFVSSGSSAILLALLSLKEMVGGQLKIVVPALSWATDVSSPMILGYEVVLCDCNIEDLSCDLNMLEDIFKNERPDVFLMVTPLGLVPKMDYIVSLCNRYSVVLIEDNCESLGSMYEEQMLGSFGELSVFSLFYGHHISTIEGGMINTNDKRLYELLLAQRSHGWSRDVSMETRVAWREQYGVDSFNDLYTFYYNGLNVRSTDLQAFLGLRMLDKVDDYANKRNLNFLRYFNGIRGNLLKIKLTDYAFTSNFAYPVVSGERELIVRDLAAAGVETRPLIAGNMGRQPFWTRDHGIQTLPNADLIHSCGFYLPNHQNLTTDEIDGIIAIVNQYE